MYAEPTTPLRRIIRPNRRPPHVRPAAHRAPVKTFAQLYAAQHGLPAADVERNIFLRSLYPHARWVAPLIEFVAPLNFAADIDMISDVAQLTTAYDFPDEVHSHRHHPEGRRLGRRLLFLRLSVGRLQRLVRDTFRAESDPPPPHAR
jgi:hypothetical protein